MRYYVAYPIFTPNNYAAIKEKGYLLFPKFIGVISIAPTPFNPM